MSIAEAGTYTGRRESALEYELRMALHALASALAPIPADVTRVEQLLRTVIDLGERTLRTGALPERPFEYAGDLRPVGAGALLAEYLDNGSTELAPLVARLDNGLLGELAGLVTAAETPPSTTVPAQRAAVTAEEVPLLLDPLDDWYTVARATVAFAAPATAAARGAERAVRPAWTALSHSAEAEVERALATARRLAADVGRAQPPAVNVSVDVLGAVNPSQVAPHACAAAVALTYLAHEGGLPTPAQLGVLPLAGCAEDGGWTPYDRAERAATAAAEAGLRPLRRDERGWRLDGDADSDATLEGAARLLWGERWEQTRRRWAQETLDAHQWSLLHSTGEADGAWLRGDGTLLVPLKQAESLAAHLRKWNTARVIQSGTRNSGKSVCARQLVTRLEALQWQSVVISPGLRHLPTDGSLPGIVRAALIAADAVAGRPTLVVLEDLHPLNDGRVGEALESLGDLKVGVLALTRYVDGATSNWDSNGVIGYMTPLPADEIPDFAHRLVRAHPDVYQAPGGDADITLAVDAAQGDLSVLVELLRDGVGAAPSPETGRREAAARVVRGQAERVCAGLGDEARTAMCRLAAVSMMDDGVPVAHLTAVPKDRLSELGVTEYRGLARIPSEVRAEAVLTCAGGDGSPADLLLSHLESYVIDILQEENGHERVRALLANRAAYAPVQLAQLLEREPVRRALAAWAAEAPAPTALRLLRLCGRHSDPVWIGEALPPVVTRVATTPGLTVRDLTTALKSLWDHQYQMPATEVADLLAWIGQEQVGGLDTVLARPATVRDRYQLARSLLRLAGDDTTPVGTVCAWLKNRADALVRGADPRRPEDLINIRKLDDLIHRWSREAEGPSPELGTQLRPLEKPGVSILDHNKPTRDTRLAAVLAWMSLYLHYRSADSWDDLIKEYEGQLKAGLAHADAIQISSALHDLARNNRGLCNRLLNNLQPGKALARVLRAATPAEAAILISTVRNIHGATIKGLLYRGAAGGSPTADPDLARDLAKSILHLKDGRGAGMLLSSVAKADDLYCDTRDGFGHRLATELGPEFARELMKRERRPAVIYYFLRGLWEAGADYRGELEEHALELVVSSIQAQRGTARPWGPRLAMLLIEDDYFGQRFLERLAERLDTRLLIDRMRNAALDPQSMVHTHRLGLAIDPAIGREFAKRVELDRAVDSKVQWSAGDVAQKLQVMASTLRAGGQQGAATVVLKVFREVNPQWDWVRRLHDVRGIGAFTTGLSQLRKLAPHEAATAVKELSTPQGDQEISHLTDLLIRSVVHPPIAADLLSALERCQPGLGRKELTSLRESRGSRWATFTEIFKFGQDPITQGDVGRKLARLGVVPATEPKAWMRTLVTDVWHSTLHLLASPRAITEILLLSYTWQAQWGEQLAETVNQDRLLRRLSLRMRADLRELPGLVTGLWLTGRDDIVDEIVRDLRRVDPSMIVEAMGLNDSGRLLKSLRHAQQPVDFLLPAVGRLLDRTLRRPLAVDAEAHWMHIGWAAQALADCGGQQYLPRTEPALRPNTTAYPAAVAWATAWLPRTEWSAAAAAEALDAFAREGTAHWHSRDACMALITAARLGRIPAAEPLATHWLTATDAGPELITLLCREADTTPAVTAHLRTVRVSARLRDLVKAPGVSTHTAYEELKKEIKRLCPPPPAPTPGPRPGLGL
ncbi:hypothetical protein ABZZ79_19820 [Streptomyces sp. NPDC006458]|uniref:hypothetical protein n=1 Tax=Streptomyces sp. NPDC006458 TaxID=3154302 RepID=UPI0033AD479A